MRRQILGLGLAIMCGLWFWPTMSEALDSRVRYRLKKIQRSLDYAEKQLQRGSRQRAAMTMTRIDRQWATMWRYYRDRISMADPEIAQADKRIKALKQKLSAAAQAPPADSPPSHGQASHRRARRPRYKRRRGRRPRRGRAYMRGMLRRANRGRGPAPGGASVQMCYGKATLAACSALEDRIRKGCSFDYGSMLPDWHQRIAQMPKVQRDVDAFMSRHQGCLAYRRSMRVKVPGKSYSKSLRRWDHMCGVPSDQNKCKKNLKRAKALWRKTIARLAKNGNNKELRKAIAYNKNPALNEDVSALQARLSSRVKRAAKARARGRARLASVRCPRAKYRNASLRRAVRRAIMSTQDKPGCRGKATPKRCWRHSLYVASYHLMSRPSQPRYHTWRRYYSQTTKVDTCVRRTVKGRTYCRVYHHLLKRVKPVGGRWGVWRPRSFSYTNMLCKHLR